MTVYDTIISNASISDSLFSATLTQSNGLESLANAALQRGIDAYTNQDYGRRVKGVSALEVTASYSQLTRIDRLLDDGNLNRGAFRDRGGGSTYIFILEGSL